MNDFKLGQDFVTRCTSDPDAPDVSVIGVVHGPLPTAEEFRAVHKAEYVSLFVEVGVPEEVAAGWHDDEWENIKDLTPMQAFDDEVEYWTND